LESLIITGLSIAVAFLIGTIEIIGQRAGARPTPFPPASGPPAAGLAAAAAPRQVRW
jgi:hypothetical protein